MRYSASEKAEIIWLVGQSALPVKRTLEKLSIPRATFYRWYDLYQSGGPKALDDRSPRPDRVWNRIPDDIRERIVQLDEPALSPRELAVRLTDHNCHRYRKVFRVRGFGLSPAEGARPDRQPGFHRDEGGR
jgi:transposase-like protein